MLKMQREGEKWTTGRGRSTSCTNLLSHSGLFQVIMCVYVYKTIFPLRGWTLFGLPGIAQPSYPFSWLIISLKFKVKSSLKLNFIWLAIYLETFITERTALEQGCIINKFFQMSIPGPPKTYYSLKSCRLGCSQDHKTRSFLPQSQKIIYYFND